ncbi:hypothetical protein Patl1_18384 [Pistacia atlantica]|uniref:Uncharacterized protein n=1 Tax=Pistacia atlantica TaxID=434234 RepID=A0ACC1BYB4_9ROSI|nr:hypothetical protein Patl1_18384 [Pistacia atlantica]
MQHGRYWMILSSNFQSLLSSTRAYIKRGRICYVCVFHQFNVQ